MGSRHTLLVVDDVEANRDLLARRLQREGFEVVHAESGQDALEILDRLRVDLVLLDVMMPGLSGLEVLQAIRDNAATRTLPVIMVTAKADSADVVRALDLGADDYVTKPLDFPVVAARVRAALRSSKTKRRDIVPGALIGQRYRLDEKIGEGGFGMVFRAEHTELKRDIAIKVLHPKYSHGSLIGRFRLEGAHACRVQHPNALHVLDSGITDDGVAYLAMELLAGHSLEHEMKRGPVPFVRCAEIIAPICAALAAAHEAGIVHRDIKPANIYLHRTPAGDEVPKILDFGIAKLVGAEGMTLEDALIGTPAYIAPERFLNQPYDGRSDVYAIGMIVHQMLCGSLPFASAIGRSDIESVAFGRMHIDEPPLRLRHRDPSVPEALCDLIARTIDKDPARRPAAGELAARLLEAVHGVAPDAVATFAVSSFGAGSNIAPDTTAVNACTTTTHVMRMKPEAD